MTKHRKSQKDFPVIESLLAVIIVGIIAGTVYFVYHVSHTTDSTLNTAVKTSQDSSPKFNNTAAKTKLTPQQQYVTIKEWGVRAPYEGSQTLTYMVRTGLNGSFADFSSTQLKELDPQCKEGVGGGSIARYDGTVPGFAESAIGQYVAGPGRAYSAHIGAYYYIFTPSTVACGAHPGTTKALQTKTGGAVQALVPRLEAIPAR